MMGHPLVSFSVLMVALSVAACSNVAFVEEVIFLNETDYPAHVEVSDETRQGWLDLTIAHRDQETIVQEVIDQGEVWIFRFEYADKHEQELEMSRSELVNSDWTVEVPQSFEDALEHLRVEPPP